ncbi:uncharacterized protein isoform X2 [Musca autumnalis]|uniref:uncharacterized protein isoform X2 n=1 Tax=Musca autumnalis TaxID=221902 RepID=UPI003CE8D232
MDRLDLSKMVDKQMQRYSKSEYFQLNHHNTHQQQGSPSHPTTNNERNPYIQWKINENKNKPKPNFIKTRIANKYEKPPIRAKTTAIANKNLTSKIIEKAALTKSNIPRLKVLCDQKEKKRLHSSIPPAEDANHFISQKRLDDLKQQNAVFTSMLEDQKQLQQDIRTISEETSSMRNNLDALRGRVNGSMKLLEQNKTYNELHLQNKPK